MLGLLNEVMQDLALSQQEVERIKFFVLSQQETMGWGDLGHAVLIGYPFYFHYNRPEEVPYCYLFITVFKHNIDMYEERKCQ